MAAHSCPLRVLHVLTSPGGLHHFPLLLPDVGLQRALAIAAVPRVVDDRGVPGNTENDARGEGSKGATLKISLHRLLQPLPSPKSWPILSLNC